MLSRMASNAAIQQVRAGVEVVILVEARYNGPDHKLISEEALKPGEIVVIAGGDYYEYLKSQEMVISVADAQKLQPEAQGEAQADETITDHKNPDDWKFLVEGGVSEAQAQMLFTAGITSKEKVVEVGAETLVEMGVSKSKATALVKWANA